MELLPEYSAYSIPVEEIYIEPLFNCREAIALITVEELARSIETRGLQFPVIVQPREDCSHIPAQYNFRLIVGFRRFTACTKILNWTKIKAIVRKGLTDTEARILNLLENIDRKDLNILEEARALAAIFPGDTPITYIATSIRRHYRWCSIRRALLKMSEKIQEAAANGIITEGDIQIIASVAPDCQLGVFRRILEQKEVRIKDGKKLRPLGVRPTPDEIKKRMDILVKSGLGGFVGRLLLWSAGLDIDDEVIDKELNAIISGDISTERLIGCEFPMKKN